MKSVKSKPSFELGRIVCTPLARGEIPADEIQKAIARHSSGDWGDVSKNDWKENDRSVRRGQILSAYHSRAGIKFWVITQADRSVTTVLLPEEY